MKNFKRKSLVLAMGLLGLGAVTGNAHAGAYTYVSSIVSAQLFNADGTTPINVGQFLPNLAATDSSSTAANLNSVPGVSADIQSNSGNSAQSYQVNPGTTAPALPAPAPENTFTPAGTGSWYARADTNLSGSLIAGLPSGPTPATSSNVSEINLTGNDFASSNANVNNNTGFTFALVGSQQVVIDLHGITSTRSFLTADAVVPPSITGSSTTWVVNVTDNVTHLNVFSWTANGNFNASDALNDVNAKELSDTINLNTGSSVSLAGSDTGYINASGNASAITGFLVGGRSYTLRVTDTTSSDSTNKNVPEPSIMGLMGMGLLGLGATRLRRHKAA